MSAQFSLTATNLDKLGESWNIMAEVTWQIGSLCDELAKVSKENPEFEPVSKTSELIRDKLITFGSTLNRLPSGRPEAVEQQCEALDRHSLKLLTQAMLQAANHIREQGCGTALEFPYCAFTKVMSIAANITDQWLKLRDAATRLGTETAEAPPIEIPKAFDDGLSNFQSGRTPPLSMHGRMGQVVVGLTNLASELSSTTPSEEMGQKASRLEAFMKFVQKDVMASMLDEISDRLSPHAAVLEYESCKYFLDDLKATRLAMGHWQLGQRLWTILQRAAPQVVSTIEQTGAGTEGAEVLSTAIQAWLLKGTEFPGPSNAMNLPLDLDAYDHLLCQKGQELLSVNRGSPPSSQADKHIAMYTLLREASSKSDPQSGMFEASSDGTGARSMTETLDALLGSPVP